MYSFMQIKPRQPREQHRQPQEVTELLYVAEVAMAIHELWPMCGEQEKVVTGCQQP